LSATDFLRAAAFPPVKIHLEQASAREKLTQELILRRRSLAPAPNKTNNYIFVSYKIGGSFDNGAARELP
jgi:hypothetical protein